LSPRGRRLLAAVSVVLAVVVGALVLSISLGRPPSIEVTGSPLLGKPAPAFSLTTLDGSQPVSLAQYAGRPLVINFWASWCVPCRSEFPMFRAARAAHQSAGLEILGIVHADSSTSAQQFAHDQAATWPLLMDPDDVAWKAYSGALVPTTFYVDRSGIVRAVSYGPPPSGTLEAELAKIL
jgi:cytochrome c biogenesis protein CcmG, thiol:disulfide interchange protein DsbE